MNEYMIVDAEEMRSILKTRIVYMNVEKKNGNKREIYCTLMEACLPTHEIHKLKSERKRNPNVIPVWDIVNTGWRSIMVDKILSWQ